MALALAVLGYHSTAASLATVLAKADPARASAIAPGDGTIISAYAEDAFAQSPTPKSDSFPAKLARRALRADPTAAGALTVLGMQAQIRGETARADQIFAYSSALSRRELRPRMWAIEKAAQRGDVKGALHNYDIALRTSRDTSRLLFPTLAAALSEPRIRIELLKIMASRPAWEGDFLGYVATSGVEPSGAVAFINEGQKSGLKVDDDVRAALVNTLALQNKFDDAWAFYRAARPTARRDRSRDPDFELQAKTRTVFDWQVSTNSRVNAAILRDGRRGSLQLSVPPSTGGEAASQTQLLVAGAYQFEGQSKDFDQPERSQPYWLLSCLDGRELGRVTVSNSNRNGGRHSGRFIVPRGCPVQKLALVVRPSEDIMGVSGQITHAQMEPTR